MRIWSWQHVSVNISSVAELIPVYCCLVLLFVSFVVCKIANIITSYLFVLPWSIFLGITIFLAPIFLQTTNLDNYHMKVCVQNILLSGESCHACFTLQFSAVMLDRVIAVAQPILYRKMVKQ